ncbi:hypothetical protein [Flavobacterium phycosphaerae]|uniref:hypothetical protein n=1 Tax=Flavobacterium phycosphaerae TaxID=2697515 RepID=UPI00138B0A83|nr:hypothetical protein [Flavobacterium phycosphaerae]
MKKFPAFLLILANNALFACGFYPSGEDLRFSFFHAKCFGYPMYSEFYYSANLFSPGYDDPPGYVEPNQKLWFEYCKGKAKWDDVYEAVYELNSADITADSKNSLIHYLFQTKDSEAINYLKFAKNSEFGNNWEEDPWERHKTFVTVKRTAQIKTAIRLAETAKNELIKFRYLFLAMRLSYYNSDVKTINELFEKNIKASKRKDIVYYWSLYFKTLAEKDSALCNFYAAQVFANAPDKRFMVSQQYNAEVPVDKVLEYAKTNQEKANVYLLAGILNVSKSLLYMEKIQQLTPNSEGLSFLLLREINKLEDWVFTPYYSLFEPSTVNSWWDEDRDKKTIGMVMDRVAQDRLYAAKILALVENVAPQKTDNPMLWEVSKAYLHFMTKDYNGCLLQLTELQNRNYAPEIKDQLEIFRALVLTANQKAGKAIILDVVKPILLKNKNYQKFIFAVGRELEYLGNTTDAALLYSLMNGVTWDEENEYYDNAFWKTKKNKGETYTDFYDNYFDYLNVMYTPEQVQALINNIVVNKDNQEEFAAYKYHILKGQISRLYDLTGTKYIRQNRLQKAMLAFKKVGNKLWNDKYTSWERNQENTWNDGSNVFDENPFYTLKYTPEFIPVKDTIRLNKYTVTKQLINYLSLADNHKTKNRDYYYFLVANCYFNMTQYGNSWMMRRYYWSSIGGVTFIEDEAEFHECNLAKHYYQLALKNAKTDKFKALCLRMMGKCEKFRLENKNPYEYGQEYNDYDTFIFSKNKYYLDLKNKYPNYYQDLVSDCTFFENYFKARR